MNAYEAIRSAIAKIMTSGQTEQETFYELSRAIGRTPFMFGDEVQKYLEKLKEQIAIHNTLSDSLINTAVGEQRKKYVRVKGEAFVKICKFYDESPSLLKPYVRMHQRALWL